MPLRSKIYIHTYIYIYIYIYYIYIYILYIKRYVRLHQKYFTGKTWCEPYGQKFSRELIVALFTMSTIFWDFTRIKTLEQNWSFLYPIVQQVEIMQFSPSMMLNSSQYIQFFNHYLQSTNYTKILIYTDWIETVIKWKMVKVILETTLYWLQKNFLVLYDNTTPKNEHEHLTENFGLAQIF